MKAREIIARVEEHTGSKIEPKRLRFHVIETLQREIDARKSLESRILAVVDGAETYNPETQKPIRRSA